LTEMVKRGYLWASFGAVHDSVASVHGPLVSQLCQTLLAVVISRVHDPPSHKTHTVSHSNSVV